MTLFTLPVLLFLIGTTGHPRPNVSDHLVHVQYELTDILGSRVSMPRGLDAHLNNEPLSPPVPCPNMTLDMNRMTGG